MPKPNSVYFCGKKFNSKSDIFLPMTGAWSEMKICSPKNECIVQTCRVKFSRQNVKENMRWKKEP
jgi:hypothetical protein